MESTDRSRPTSPKYSPDPMLQLSYYQVVSHPGSRAMTAMHHHPSPLGGDPVNLAHEGTLANASKPGTVARHNTQEVTVLRVDGQYYWHVHPESDDLFYFIDGEIDVELSEPHPTDDASAPASPATIAEDDRPSQRMVHLAKGDMFVVPPAPSTGRRARRARAHRSCLCSRTAPSRLWRTMGSRVEAGCKSCMASVSPAFGY